MDDEEEGKMKRIGEFLRDERGTSAIELAIMIGVLTFAAIVTVSSMSIGLVAWRRRRKSF
jgi:Flp pilus assembly pilin Flp